MVKGLSPDYVRVDYFQPHWNRNKKIIEKYPQVEKLFGPDYMSAVWIVSLVVFTVYLAYLLRDSSYSTIFLTGYCIGAVTCHALWVLIHEASHNLVVDSTTNNMLMLIVANIPHVYPTSVSFRYYHHMHHAYLNETYMDPDLPSPWEARVCGNTAIGKMFWLFFFPLFQGVRVTRYGNTIFDQCIALNFIVQIIVNASIFYFWGHKALLFLFISSFFAIGFHPLGARWIAEHYAVHPNQETYSYYGWCNKIAFNIGYHNEHHDLVKVPWSRLPALKKMAPEFYDSLFYHDSYLTVLYNFFFDSNFTLRSRVVRSKSM